MLNYIYDIICLVVILISVIVAFHKGLASSLLNFAGKVVALVVAYMAASPVAHILYTRFFEAGAVRSINNILSTSLDEEGNLMLSAEAVVTRVGEYFDGQKMPFGTYFSQKLANVQAAVEASIENGSKAVAQTIAHNVYEPVVTAILGAIMVVLLFVVISLICSGLASALQLVNKIPLIGSLNKVLGGVFGVFTAFLGLYIFAIVVNLFVCLTNQKLPIINDEVIQASYLFKLIYQFTPFQ